MRYLIGIDAAKAKNDIAIFNSDMGLVRKPFTVSQSQSDIQKLAKSFAAIDGDVRAVVESTGRYHLPIVEQLSKERIFVSVVNPKLIKQFGDNSLRNVKNDPADAKKICRYGILNWDSLREYTNMDELRTQLQLYNSQFEFFYVPESLGQVQSYRFVRYDLSGYQSALQQSCQTGWQREMGGLRRTFLACGLRSFSFTPCL